MTSERSTLQRDRSIVSVDPGGLRNGSSNGYPVRDVLLHSPIARPKPVVLVQVRLVPDLDEVEDDARCLNGEGLERAHDRLGHVDGVGDVVRAEVHAPRHVRATGEPARELVVFIADRDPRRLGVRRERARGRELVLVDRHRRRPDGVVLGVRADADLGGLARELGEGEERVVRELVAGVDAGPVGPAVLLDGEREEGTGERLRVGRGPDGERDVDRRGDGAV